MSWASVFGMVVRVADNASEWERALEAAKKEGGVEVGNATRNDYDIVIDEAHGLILVNPGRADAILQAMRTAIPEAPAEKENR